MIFEDTIEYQLVSPGTKRAARLDDSFSYKKQQAENCSKWLMRLFSFWKQRCRHKEQLLLSVQVWMGMQNRQSLEHHFLSHWMLPEFSRSLFFLWNLSESSSLSQSFSHHQFFCCYLHWLFCSPLPRPSSCLPLPLTQHHTLSVRLRVLQWQLHLLFWLLYKLSLHQQGFCSL